MYLVDHSGLKNLSIRIYYVVFVTFYFDLGILNLIKSDNNYVDNLQMIFRVPKLYNL